MRGLFCNTALPDKPTVLTSDKKAKKIISSFQKVIFCGKRGLETMFLLSRKISFNDEEQKI